MTNRIKAAYEDGVCPDCGEDISNDVVEGDACHNCGHVFYPPDEWQEWHDFDPDC